ncbi:GAF domain-containing sensor histidine kinase [Thermogemmatispora onikobensis]|uniref:GAF domain-containing sensor histidine kinase n=1 Tax=Thermogemmatispora onikobensis TaxID=732234 RepID=UPI000853357D|nr:GAF domain-containing protein [Thermogemmatispora onikobensis]
MVQTSDDSRTNLIASLQERAEELAQLNRIAIALTSEFDLQRLLQMITDAARKVTAAEYAAFFLIPELTRESPERRSKKGLFHLAAISGEHGVEEHFRHVGPVEGVGVLHPVFWKGTSVLVDDVLADRRYLGIPRGHIPVRSFLGVQLRTREGSILGAFLIGHTQPDRFKPRHVELIEALSAQAAVAIHNAQLIARERHAMEEQAARLEREVRERTAELERRNQELTRVATDLQTLHHELTEAQKRQMLADERSRIAQELHDRVQQTLFTIGLKADWALEQLPPGSPLERPLLTIKQLASLGTAQVRDAIFALSSSEPQTQDGGLISRLHTLIHDLRESAAGLDMDLVVAEWASAPPAAIENALFNVAREALSNVLRHAQATTVVVTVQVTRTQAMLVVQDNGVGLAPEILENYRHNPAHLGLRGMQQRVSDCGGQLLLVNGEEGGLIVKAVIPLDSLTDRR